MAKEFSIRFYPSYIQGKGKKSRDVSIHSTFWICHLLNFECDIPDDEEIDLGHGIILFKISDLLKQHIKQNIEREIHFASGEEYWAITLPYNPSGRTLSEDSPVKDDFEIAENDLPQLTLDFITGLRLERSGNVQLGPTWKGSAGKNHPVFRGVSTSSGAAKIGTEVPFTRENEYLFRKNDLDSFKNMWSGLQAKRKEGKLDDLEISIGRFNSSYDEVFEDRLIDHMVALESLYLGDIQELSYKLALRVAFLIERGKKGRIKVFKRLKQAYDARSKVIHGLKPPANLPELVADTEEYLRQSIKLFLKLSEQYRLKDLRERVLDENIIEAGQLLKAK